MARTRLTPIQEYNPVKFSVYLAGSQTLSAGAYTVIAFDTRTFDTGSNVDITTNKGRFTATAAGFYMLNAAFQSSLSGVAQFGSKFRKNGTTDLAIGSFFSNSGTTSTANHETIAVAFVQLAANDYVEYMGFCNGAVSVASGATNSFFSGFLVSAT
jgi:hypothetical protein